MTEAKQNPLAPILYLPHGGGPMPLLGDASHAGMVNFWKRMAEKFPTPDAIVMISAHWEADVASITAGEAPELIYDYYNFPPETYQYKYPSPGHPELATQMAGLLGAGNIPAKLDADDQQQSRAFDDWLVETCCADALTAEQREQRLSHWESAPSGRFCHPREEHLLPLQVCFGMAVSGDSKAEHAYSEQWNGLAISAFLWGI